jgi:hypothetical protein
MLPELKSGDVLITKAGRKVTVLLVNTKPRLVTRGKIRKASMPRVRRLAEFNEPLYRLVHQMDGYTITGNAEWTLDELNAAGMKLA